MVVYLYQQFIPIDTYKKNCNNKNENDNVMTYILVIITNNNRYLLNIDFISYYLIPNQSDHYFILCMLNAFKKGSKYLLGL